MRLLVIALVPVLAVGCLGPRTDPDSGLPAGQPGERHVRFGGVWIAHHPADPEGKSVIFQDGSRLAADGLHVLWATRFVPATGWDGLPNLEASQYPVVLVGRTDQADPRRIVFLAARSARDGRPVTSASGTPGT